MIPSGKPLLAVLAFLVALTALPVSAREGAPKRLDQVPLEIDLVGEASTAPAAIPETAAPGRATSARPLLVRAKVMRPSRHFSKRIHGADRVVRFHNVTAKEQQEPNDLPAFEFCDLSVWVGSIEAIKETGNICALAESKAFRDFPRRGMETLVLKVWTGGNHCCFTYYLLTRRKGAMRVAKVELENAIGVIDVEGGLSYPVEVMDGRFNLYELGGLGDPGFGFGHANSPFCTRYLVYGPRGWRVDRPGEFSALYQKLIRDVVVKIKRSKADQYTAFEPAKRQNFLNLDRASLLIEKAYYSLMAGEAASRVLGRFRREMPKPFRVLAPEIFKDIQSAARAFNPVTQRVY